MIKTILIIYLFTAGVPIVVNSTKVVPGGTVVVAWEPPFEGACPVVNYTVYYREVMSSARNNSWYSVTVPRNKTSCTLHLTCRKEYDVAVTSQNGFGESPLNDSKIWNFKTGGGKVVSELKCRRMFQSIILNE